ncbi:MAG: hypothetical protein CR966_00690 [Pseudomonadales bacterium]|nr:MAG: hypothetical protein CR966_00690 [Pseudomonadales bacterium]
MYNTIQQGFILELFTMFNKNKLNNRLKSKALAMVVVSIYTLLISACGFQLRNDASNTSVANKTLTYKPVIVNSTADEASTALKQPVIQQLNMLGIKTATETATTNNKYAHIEINEVGFRKYQLIGVLTEIRVVISAKVTYTYLKNGKVNRHVQPLQVEKSYQFNKASVSAEDQQGEQIRDWLTEALARRIADQYFTLVN